LAREAGMRVVPIPGASAVTAALSVSGLSGTRFLFLGFPPSSGKERDEWVAALGDEPGIAVFFESPHRIRRTLGEITPLMGNRPIIVNREITKQFEELVITPNDTDSSWVAPELGEFVVIVGPKLEPDASTIDGPRASLMLGRITDSCGISDDDGLRAVAAILKAPLPKVRRAIKKARIQKKRDSEAGS